MDRNMSDLERAIRAFVIAPLAAIAAWFAGWTTLLAVMLLVVAAIMVVTAIVGFCPLYALLGIRTKAEAAR